MSSVEMGRVKKKGPAATRSLQETFYEGQLDKILDEIYDSEESWWRAVEGLLNKVSRIASHIPVCASHLKPGYFNF